MTTQATYTVEGMTCSHCVQSVTSALQGLAGVETVSVDLATGAVAVVSHEPLPETSVRAAMQDAGYQLVG